MASNTTKTLNFKAWNSPVENPSWEYKLDIKDSDGNMFNPIYFKKKGSGKGTSWEASSCWAKIISICNSKWTYYELFDFGFAHLTDASVIEKA